MFYQLVIVCLSAQALLVPVVLAAALTGGKIARIVGGTSVVDLSNTPKGPSLLDQHLEQLIQSVNARNVSLVFGKDKVDSGDSLPATTRDSDVESIPFNQTLINEILTALYYSAITYSSDSDIKGWNCTVICGQELVAGTDVSVAWNLNDPAAKGYIGHDNKSKTIVVAFEGTDTSEGWNSDVHLKLVRFPKGASKDDAWGRAHEGFTDTVSEIYKNTKSTVRDLSEKYSDSTILFTGHSRGAALSALYFGLFLNDNKDFAQRTRIITFGQPRVGDEDLARHLNSFNAIEAYRVVHQDDIVPHLPPQALGYRQCFQQLWLREREDDEKRRRQPRTGASGPLQPRADDNDTQSIEQAFSETASEDYALYLCGDGKMVGQVDDCKPNSVLIALHGRSDHHLDNYIKGLRKVEQDKHMGKIA